ncbi:MAG TPA: hypothetical protein VGZ50_00140 [Actinomycetota bacterium]|nr:hypothetical protein [Actinomycetota bacterium]
MGEAREILDQLTEASFNQDYATVEELYAPASGFGVQTLPPWRTVA